MIATTKRARILAGCLALLSAAPIPAAPFDVHHQTLISLTHRSNEGGKGSKQ